MQMSFYKDWTDTEDVHYCAVLTADNNKSLCVPPGLLFYLRQA